MFSSISLTALVAALSLTFENAAPASARRLTGRLTGPGSDLENSYIVKLKDGTNTTSHINSLPFSFSIEDENSPITHWWPEFFIGYSGIFVGSALDAILTSPDVEYVEKNDIMRGADSQTDAIWNLQATSTRQPVGGTDPDAEIYTYTYNQPVGEGVDIYVVDSGVYTEHAEFEDRARFGWAARGLGPGDGVGHGTHIAGTAAGMTYGVAKRANIISVRVLDNNNYGTHAQGISGINWVGANVRSTGRLSIACLAFSGARNEGINDATTILVGDGITVVTAAGNGGQDASGWSPASADAVIVVGASDITNAMWPGSNFGPLVDLFAPGVDIWSAWNTGPTITAKVSGTSQACAHVAGVAAYLLSMDNSLTPGPMFNKILSLVTENVISGVPAGTSNNFVYNGIVP